MYRFSNDIDVVGSSSMLSNYFDNTKMYMFNHDIDVVSASSNVVSEY